MRPSLYISTTPVIQPRIVLPSHAPRGVVCRLSAWHGRTKAAGTMVSMRRFPGAVPRLPTLLESVLRGERMPVVVLLVLVPVISWTWIVITARDMYGPMTGASAWMMTLHWDLAHLLLLCAMWTVMMTGMMLPSAAPLVLLYGAAARRSAPQTAARQTYALAAGYVAAWTTFS